MTNLRRTLHPPSVSLTADRPQGMVHPPSVPLPTGQTLSGSCMKRVHDRSMAASIASPQEVSTSDDDLRVYLAAWRSTPSFPWSCDTCYMLDVGLTATKELEAKPSSFSHANHWNVRSSTLNSINYKVFSIIKLFLIFIF